MRQSFEYIDCHKLWSRYYESSMATLRARNQLDSLIRELHKTEIRISYVGEVYKNLRDNAGVTRMDRIKKLRKFDLTQVTYEGKFAISKQDYLGLIQHRKDLNILIAHYKKEWNRAVTRMNRYLMAYRTVLEFAKTTSDDAVVLQKYPVAIIITDNKLGKFDVWYDKQEDGKFHKIINM